MKRIGVITSGGDAPGMNAAIRAVVRTAIYMDMEVYGFRHGYQGILHKTYDTMIRGSVADIIHRGGTILQTARCEEFRQPQGRKKAAENLEALGVEGLIVIGGDGSFTGAELLYKEQGVPVLGVPGTIDNDISGTDYCIGFDTAMDTILDAVNKIRDTATSHERIFVVEVMGRTRGQLALYAGLAAGAESIIIPERKYVRKNVLGKLDHGFRRGKKHSIILIAEGVNCSMIGEEEKYPSPSYALAETIREHTGMETRVIVLGHLQRGGTPSGRDRILASRMGARAVEALKEGKENVMVGIQSEQLVLTPIDEVLASETAIDTEMLQLAHILSL